MPHPHDQDDELPVHDLVEDPVVPDAQPVTVIAVGEPAQVIDDGRADLADEQRWFTGPAMMTAWGQRPPG